MLRLTSALRHTSLPSTCRQSSRSVNKKASTKSRSFLKRSIPRIQTNHWRSFSKLIPPNELESMPASPMEDMELEGALDANETVCDHPSLPSNPIGSSPNPLVSTPQQTSQSPLHTPLRHSSYSLGHRHFQNNKPAFSSPSGGSTFVSSYYRIDSSVFGPYLNRKNLVHKQNEKGEIVVRDCPFCHDTKGHPTNLWKLYIYTDNGRFFCFRCSTSGSWFDFQKRLGDSFGPTSFSQTTAPSRSPPPPPKMPEPSKLEKYISNLEKLPQAFDYLTNTRKLTPEVIEKYKVGSCVLRVYMPEVDENGATTGGPDVAEDHVCITFPWIELNKNGKEVFVRTKSRSISSKSTQRLEPIGGRWGMFGMHLVPQDATSIIVTEGEFDAMAVYQATGMPAVSLPAGANCFPVEIVEKLERFDRIYLWMDDDVVGQQGAQKFAMKLGRERCWIVQTRAGKADGPKDANDALRAGGDLKALLDAAKPMPHQEILSFQEIRDAVYREMANPDQVAGVQSLSFPTLNKLIRGHRKGELTIFSGPTGIGKTTILSQMSLDYVIQGVPTLWGSFELNNVRLAKKLLTQYAQKDLESNIGEFQLFADRFAALPLHFMRFHGSTDLEQVMDAMEYAVYVHDVEHVVIDNLQFMTPQVGKGYERFELLDSSISRLRKFATLHNIHISLIIHPRKEDEGHALSTSSVFGSAKATQEADNVIMVQQGKYYRYLEVTKNRFSGDLGKIPYKFVRANNRYVEMTLNEIQEAQKSHLKPSQRFGRPVFPLIRFYKPPSIGSHGFTVSESLSSSPEDLATVLPLSTLFPSLETLKLSVLRPFASALIPRLPSSLTSISLGGVEYPTNYLDVELICDFLSVADYTRLPLSLTTLSVHLIVSHPISISHPLFRFLRLDSSNCAVPSDLCLPHLQSAHLRISIQQWRSWLLLLHQTPIRELILQDIKLTAIDEIIREGLLPPTLTALKDSWAPNSWEYNQGYSLMKSNKLKNLLEEGPQVTTRIRLLNPLDLSTFVINPLVETVWSALKLPNSVLEQLPSSRLLEINLPNDDSWTDETISLLPASLLSLMLHSNTSICDYGISLLPRGLTILHMGRSRDRITPKAVLNLPPSLTLLQLRFVRSWQDQDIALLPRSLTQLDLRNLIHLTDLAFTFLPSSIIVLNFKNNRLFTSYCLRLLPKSCIIFNNTKNPNFKRSDHVLLPLGLQIQ